jgi:hypothetical protein
MIHDNACPQMAAVTSLNLKCILLTTQFGSCTVQLAAVHASEGDFMMLEVEVKQMTQAWL